MYKIDGDGLLLVAGQMQPAAAFTLCFRDWEDYMSHPRYALTIVFILLLQIVVTAQQAAMALDKSGFSAGVTFTNSPGIPRFPDVDQTRIVFVYAGDLWIVHKSGGTGVRLTNAS